MQPARSAFRRAAVVAVPAFASILTTLAWAQSGATPIDSGHSYASFWMTGNAETAQPVNVAVAQAAGTATLHAARPADSSLVVNLVPGGDGADLLAPDGSLREGVIARILRYTFLSFRSTKAHVRPDGLLEFSGDLTVTHVTREQIPTAWNSATTAPSYTDPVITRKTYPVAFVLTSPHAQFLSTYQDKKQPYLASAAIPPGAFPELTTGLLDAYWPTVAQDEQCEFPVDAAGRRDYSGTVCTGKAIATTNVTQPPPSFARDYSGRPAVRAAPGGRVTILLYLKLAGSDSGKSPGY